MIYRKLAQFNRSRLVAAICATFVLGLVWDICRDVSARQWSFPLAAQSRSAQQPASAPITLEAGKPLGRLIQGGQSHSYQLRLEPGQYAAINVTQRGIDVIVSTFGPAGQLLSDFDAEYRKQGEEAVSVVADSAGLYRIEVKPKSKSAQRARYEIRLLETRAASEQEQALERAHRLITESGKQFRAGKYDAALAAINQAVEIEEKWLAAESPELARTLRRAAKLHFEKGQYQKAEELYLRALAIQKKSLGEQHPDVAITLSLLAEVRYLITYDPTKLEAQVIPAKQIFEQTLTSDQPELCDYLRTHAFISVDKGDPTLAAELYQRELTITEAVYGSDQAEVILPLCNLATFYSDKGDFLLAAPLFQRALTISEKTLELNHPIFAYALSRAGTYLNAKGDYEKAESLFLRAISILERTLGGEHYFMGETLNNLAAVYSAKGESKKAELFYVRAVAIYEGALGRDHPWLAAALANLATIYSSYSESTLTDYEKAEQLYQRVLAIEEKNNLQNTINYAATLNNFAYLYSDIGNYAESERLFKRSGNLSKAVWRGQSGCRKHPQ
jgi:tetratricopeptide (TPR) repeat protein